MLNTIYFLFLAHFIPGLLLLALSWTGCDVIAAVAFLTMSLGFNGASAITNIQNSQDLAPNFAGTLYGIINCIGGTTGFITPMLTGYMTKEHVSVKLTIISTKTMTDKKCSVINNTRYFLIGKRILLFS